MPAKQKTPSFESALEDLEKLVAELERGDGALEEQLKTFEKGIALSRECLKRLDEVEKRIQVLTDGPEGELLVSELAD